MKLVRTLLEKLDNWDKPETVPEPESGYFDNNACSCARSKGLATSGELRAPGISDKLLFCRCSKRSQSYQREGCRNIHEMRSSDTHAESGVFGFLHEKARQVKAMLGYAQEQIRNDDTQQCSPCVRRLSIVKDVKGQHNVAKERLDKNGFNKSPSPEDIGASSPKDEDLDSSTETLSMAATSWTDRVRKMSQNIRREIILKHRRHEKQRRLQVKAEIYRNKYRTNDKVSSTKNDIAKDITAKNKRFMRLFKTNKTRLTTRNANETRSVRDRVALKLAKRRRVYEGCTRDQVTADIRQKYFNDL